MVSSSSLTNYETASSFKQTNSTLPNHGTGTLNGSSTNSSNNNNNNNNNGSIGFAKNGSFNGSTLHRQPSQMNRHSFNTNSSYSRIHYPTSSYQQFQTSSACNPGDFYFRTLLRYVRSGNAENYFEKLEFILKQCPTFCVSSSKSSMSSATSTSGGTGSSSQFINTSLSTSSSTGGNNNASSNATPLSPTSNLVIHHLQSHHYNNSSHHNHHQQQHHSSHHSHANCIIKLTDRSRSALIALMILVIENYHLKVKLKKMENIEVTDSHVPQLPQLNADLLNYLLSIFENLPNIKWVEETLTSNANCNLKHRLPTVEVFTFMFNTGLTELASIYPLQRNKIISCQYKLIGDLIKTLSPNLANIDIVKTITTNSLVMNDKVADVNKTCRVIVPIMIGVLRSLGRVSGIPNVSILSLIYHDNHLKDYICEKTDQLKPSKTIDSLATSISSTPNTQAPSLTIPRGSIPISNSKSSGMSKSSSTHSAMNMNKNCLFSSLNLADFLNPILGYNELAMSSSSLLASSFALNPNLEVYFTHTIGSSYYNGTAPYSLILNTNELKDLCQLIKKLFVKNVISAINRNLNEYIAQQQHEQNQQKQIPIQKQSYVYHSYSEILSLVTISMFRDLLLVHTNNIDLSLCHDLKNLVQEFYRLELVVISNDRSNSNDGPNELCNPMNGDASMPSTPPAALSNPSNSASLSSASAFFNHHASRIKSKLNVQTILPVLNSNNSPNSGQMKVSTTWISLRNNLSILANAAAIELYFLCVEDEQDAEKLCTKCSEKFFLNLTLTETIAQAPLIASCIQVLGRLAYKYPNLSKISVRHLTDFLTEPSPILLKQYKHIIDKLNPIKPTTLPSNGNRLVLNSVFTPLNQKPAEFQPGHSKAMSVGVNGRQSNANIDLNNKLTSISRNQTINYKNGNVSFSKSTRIFEFLRDSTIECLCLSLNSCYNVDKDCIKAACTKLASRLHTADILDSEMMTFKKFSSYSLVNKYHSYILDNIGRLSNSKIKQLSRSTLISHNGILTLGKIAINLNHIAKTQEGVLQIYHQKLCSPPSSLDQLILEHFGNILISTSSTVYQDILSTLMSITAETSLTIYGDDSDISKPSSKYKHVASTVIKVLEKVANNISSETEMNDLLIKLLELFCKIGVRMKENMEKLTKNTQKSTSSAGNLGVLIPVLSVLLKRIPLEAKFQSRLFKLFRDFWFFCVVFGFTDESSNTWPLHWYRSVALIATKSPVLLSKEHLKSELHHNSAFKNEQISPNELLEIRNSLSSQLTDFADTYQIIKNLTFAQCSYLQSVFKLEKLRIINLSNAYSFQQIFHYLEDTTIQKDKAGIWYCILCMANKNFNTYLDAVSKLPKTVERDQDLENMVQFLLVKFNHIHKRLRQLADTLLSRIMDKFSYLLWSEKTLRCLMDITELLASSLNMDTNQVAPEFDVPNTNFKLKVLDNMEGRESTVNDFTQRCSAFLQESLQFAPITAKSHIQNYMLQLQQKGENIYNHSGVSMMLDCVMKYSKPRADAESLDTQSLLRRPDCVKKDFSSFIGQMNEKYNYVGIVQGLCKNNSDVQVVKNLCMEMRQSCVKKKQKQLKEAMLKAAAFITLMKTKGIHSNSNINFEREILHELSICCSGLFSKQTIEVAIECWSWVISSRIDVEPLVVEEMVNAWQMTVDLRLGMFSPTVEEPNPLAKEEKDELKPRPPANIDAHRVWIKYFQERLDIAKNKSDFENELFINLMHKTLAFATERLNDSCLNRHVSCVGLRFRFLVMALSLLQSSSSLIPNAISKWILRERIYYSGFDYFTVSSRVPTQSYTDLREDLKYLLEFWNKIVNEKKYLKEETFLNGLETLHNNSLANGNGTPDATSVHGFTIDQQNGKPTMVASDTYQSLAGITNSATINTELNNPSNLGVQTGALQHLVVSSALFLEPTMISLNNSNNNNASQSQFIPRVESTLFNNNNKNQQSIHNSNGNGSHNWTLSKRGNTIQSKHPIPQSYTDHTASSQVELHYKQQQQKYFKDYFKKRNLLLCLVSHELDHLYTFHNPFNNPSLNMERMEIGINHFKDYNPEKKEKFNADAVRIAWSVTPALAIFLPNRFTHDEIVKKVQTYVKSQPERVLHIPQAAAYLATEQNILNDSIELNYLLIWSRVPAIVVLNYFGKGSRGQSLANPMTAQFTSKNLMISKPETLLNYIPQLVNALRYDDFGYVREVIFWLAKHSQLLSHQLIWNLTTNVYRDQDAKIKDPQIGEQLEMLIHDIENNLTGLEKEFFKREFDFFAEITEVSAKIKDKPLGDERKKACQFALKQIKLQSDCYLPSNPDAIVVQILDGIPMQSAAKAPYLARFTVQRIKLSDLEKIGKNGLKIEPNIELQYQSACIFKVGDDVRQDMLALQIMELLKNVFQQEGLELFLFPYRVIATKPGCGVIECVPNSRSRDEIGRQTDIDLYQYFLDKYGGPDTSEFQRARRNFIMSMAGYSLFMFLIQIKDRHNGNLMLDKDGHLIHIDFGFMIESSPGGNLGFEPDMKITTEMGQIMGDINSPSFQWFMELCIKGYLAIRPYRENIITLVSLMLETGLPCFRGKSIETLRARFNPHLNEREAANYITGIVNKSYNNWRTNTYDSLQYMQNSIYKPG